MPPATIQRREYDADAFRRCLFADGRRPEDGVSARALRAPETRDVRRSQPLAWNAFHDAVQAGGCAVGRVEQAQQDRAVDFLAGLESRERP